MSAGALAGMLEAIRHFSDGPWAECPNGAQPTTLVPSPFPRQNAGMARKRILSPVAVKALLDALERARRACTDFIGSAPINEPHYRAVGEVMRAIDGFAEVATGSREHFHAKTGSIASRDGVPRHGPFARASPSKIACPSTPPQHLNLPDAHPAGH